MVLGAVITAFVVAALPAIIFMTIWTAVSVMRILFPDRPLPLLHDGAAERRAALERGESVPVHFREIHEDLRVYTKELARQFDLVGGCAHGIPEAWIDDLWQRKN